jgi:hypothetical protein
MPFTGRRPFNSPPREAKWLLTEGLATASESVKGRRYSHVRMSPNSPLTGDFGQKFFAPQLRGEFVYESE